MDKSNLIKNIEENRQSRVITYITGDRQPFATRIADDVIPVFNRHLENIGRVKKISLFLYTRGGDMVAPLRLVKLIRSSCNEFEVLVPYRCHSAGTLIALGADKIVMGKLGELSPVDPTTMHPYNPQNPLNPQQRLEISVEDLNSYFLLAREMAKVKEEEMDKVFTNLTEKIHPLSLGNAYRAFRMGKMIAEKLLEMPKTKKLSKEEIKKVVEEVTSRICIHGYPITRDEAEGLGLPIEKAKGELEKDLWDLYEIYAKEMKLGIPFHPLEVLGDKELAEVRYAGAYIESDELSDQFVFKGKVQKTIRDNRPAIDMNIDSQKWEQIK
ncbi:MAG: hypothetical protein QME57_02480 [Patescibacteria group bacterium]|nr:hypothetical protein [Patescibacteria group bacterium]